MSVTFNHIVISGKVTQEPEFKTLESGIEACRLNVTSEHEYKKKDGTVKIETCSVVVDTYGTTAVSCQANLTQGSTVVVSGRLKTSKYTDKNGIERWVTSLMAEDVCFMGTLTDAKEVAPKKAFVPSAPKPNHAPTKTTSYPHKPHPRLAPSDFEDSGELPF